MIEAPGVSATGLPSHRLDFDPTVVIRSLTCPICERKLPPGAAAESRWFPFCSERCRNVDLYRWSAGRYAIVEPLTPDEDAEVGPMGDPGHDEG